MLGSAMDAEDMVQETYLRYQNTPKDSIGSLKAFLTTIISRLCVDQLHLARRQREQYLGPWLPEPILTADSREVINLALRAYQQAVPQLQAGGATLVAISPQMPQHSQALAEKLGLTFALLSDRGNQVAREYGLVFTIDKALRRAHLLVGADLPAFNGTDAWDLPMAGTFLVDRSGTVRLAFVDPDFTRRLDPSVILARLNELKD
jgi:peroxiredoxin